MKTLLRSLIVAGALAGAGAPVVAHAQVVVRGPGVRVRFAPPALRVEVRPLQPSPRHVWLDGHWRWEGGRHVWWPGRWELGRPGYVWAGPRWVQQGPEWVFVEGSWQPQQPVVAVPPQPVVEEVPGQPLTEVYAESAPPPPQQEVIPVAPSPNHFWVAGHWYWRNGWVWVRGHHELRRGPGFWEPAHWAQWPGGRWRYVPGHWRR